MRPDTMIESDARRDVHFEQPSGRSWRSPAPCSRTSFTTTYHLLGDATLLAWGIGEQKSSRKLDVMSTFDTKFLVSNRALVIAFLTFNDDV